jgi:hypothetical protein
MFCWSKLPFWPLSMNGPTTDAKNMQWLVEPIGILVLHEGLLEEKWEAHLLHFCSIRL